jgi:hypothetical protein
MDFHQTRVSVETVLSLYSTLKFGHPVKVCAFFRNRPNRLERKRELASDNNTPPPPLNSMNPSKKQRYRKNKRKTPALKDRKINTLHTKKCDVDAVLQSALIVVYIDGFISPVLSSPPSMFCNFSFGCCPNTACPSHGDL